MNNIFSNYPDIISTALIPMIIAIFALGFPLLIQTISRIDDKYNSTVLIKTFRKDWICKWFLWILVISIASYVIWLLRIPPLIECGWIIDNSALILVALSTIALIVMTFFIVYLTYIYYVPELLLNRLIKKFNKTKTRKTLYFEAISKILFYSIDKADESFARTLLEFYYEAFIGFRKNKEGQTIEYPQEYYDTVFEANELLCNRKKKTISYFNDSTLFELFLDQYQKTVISSKTYSFLWRLIVQSILYDKEEFVLAYWRKAHQLCNLFMQSIYPEYDNSLIGNLKIKNQTEIDKRDKERKDFFEFHYALGGLLMYKQKYAVIKEMMNYTQQQPPKYVLVPERMQQVIEKYMQINQREYYNPVYYEQRYWFPDIYGVNSDDKIRMWIKRYLAILFIRQYTLHQYYINANPLIMPQPPENLSELNRWKDELDGLKYFVDDCLSQKSILEQLGFGEICNPNWFDDNGKEKPSVLIENFKKLIEGKFNKIKAEQPIDKDKEKKFQEETVKHLTPVFDKYKALFNNEQMENYQSHFIGGRFDILSKTAFAKNQDVGYINSDSITAQGVAMEFSYYAINTLFLMFPHKYLLAEKETFLAINKLNIDAENYVIIAVGLNIEYYSYLQVDGLRKVDDKWHYNNFRIIEIDNYSNNLVSQSLFVVKKDDLPNIIFKESSEEIISKYHLEKVDNTYNIYAKLNNLNEPENKTIQEELGEKNYQVKLSEAVLACVNINVEIQYKSKAKCVQIKVFSQFNDRGKANKIEDIESIE